MDGNQENCSLNRLKREIDLFKANYSSIVNIEELANQLIRENIDIRQQREALIAENVCLQKELDSANFEMAGLRSQNEIYRTEVMELRHENDLLNNKCAQNQNINHKAVELLLNQFSHKNGSIISNVVNSLPSFGQQMVLTERPNSVTTFTSINEMSGMRFTPSAEDQMDRNENSTETTTSDGTYYDATSHRSSINNQCNGVRPKVCQQNEVSSTVTSTTPEAKTAKLDESHASNSFSFDENDNLKLQLVNVLVNRQMPVTIAYISTPSSFWLHTNEHEVLNFLHIIQVKQQQLKECGDYKLTANNITVGMYCAAIYSSDGYWYRAQVVGIRYKDHIKKDTIKSVEVMFIDWGNTEEVPLSKVMKLSKELTKRKQAIHCYLQGMGLEHIKWSQKAIDTFKDGVDKKVLLATFSKCHKVNETLDSVIYPVDLIVKCENGQTENIVNYLPTPELSDDEELKPFDPMKKKNTVSVTDTSNATFDTVICDLKANSVHNPEMNASVNFNLDNKITKETKCKFNVKADPFMYQSLSQSLPENVCKTNSMPDNNKLQIPPPIIPDGSDGLIVVPSHVISPSQFFVHINDTRVGIAQLEDLDEQLYNYYSNYEPSNETESSQLTAGSFWSCQYTEDQRWYRCRVIQVYRSSVLVSYVDYGNVEEVDVKSLMPLTRQFATYPALAVRCGLSGLSPIGANDWSEDSVKYFKELIGYIDENISTAFISQKPENFNFDSKLEVLLWTNDSKEQTAKDILVNSKLVIEKYAKTDNMEWVLEAERALRESTPPEITSQIINKLTNNKPIVKPIVNGNSDSNASNKVRYLPELSQHSSDDDDWDPMADDANCITNNYAMIPDDAATATLGFRPKDVRTCKYFGTAKGCRLNEYCTFLHVTPDQRFAIRDEEDEQLNIDDLELEVGSSVMIKVTGIQSPYSFFGVLPFGNQPLSETQCIKASNNEPIDASYKLQQIKQMSSQLKKYYSNPKAKENPNIYHAIGTLVAYKDEENYFRGRVLSNDEDMISCQVFNIDFGFSVEVERTAIFKLEKIFTQFPSLSIQCSLFSVEPFSSNGLQSGLWSKEAIEAFSEWTLEKYFEARVLSRKLDNKISVELISHSNFENISISQKLVEHKLAQIIQNYCLDDPSNHLSDDDIYASDPE